MLIVITAWINFIIFFCAISIIIIAEIIDFALSLDVVSNCGECFFCILGMYVPLWIVVVFVF